MPTPLPKHESESVPSPQAGPTPTPLPPLHVARPYELPLYAPAETYAVETPDGARIAAWRYAPAADSAVLANAANPARYPVLMLHGNGEEHGIFGVIITALVACGREVVAVDSRAQGASTRGTESLTYGLMTRDAAAVLDAAGVARAHVLGFSDGAIEGLLMARDYPERVASLTAIGANLTPDGIPGNDEFEEVARLYAAWAASPRSAQTGAEAATYKDGTPAPTREQAAWTAELLHLMVIEPHIDPKSLVRISCPTCIMSGELDEIPQAETARIAAVIPGARKVIVPHAEHTLPKVAPEAVLRELLVTIAAAE